MLISVNPEHPEPRKIRRAADALAAGEVIGYPTDTIYGLGCDLFNKKAIDRLYQIKAMDRSHHVAFICADLSNIARYAIVEDQAYRLLRHCLPGPYCFVLSATREVPKLVQSKRKTVGIRVPNNPVIQALVREFGGPIVSTSATIAGGEGFVDPNEIDDAFSGLGLILDGGSGGVTPTTVVDLTSSPARIIREGAGPVDAFL